MFKVSLSLQLVVFKTAGVDSSPAIVKLVVYEVFKFSKGGAIVFDEVKLFRGGMTIVKLFEGDVRLLDGITSSKSPASLSLA